MGPSSTWLPALAPHSETAAVMAAHDWSSTPLGPQEQWPDTLRMAVSLCLASDFPMLVAWGRDLLMIYNEGYRAMLGDKHPASVGEPVRAVWPEIWAELEPLFDQVRETGTAYNAAHLPLAIHRNGYLEEAFFTFCYSAILDDGKVAGTLNVAMETTAQVVAERRLTLLSNMAASMVVTQNVTDVCVAAVRSVEGGVDVGSAEVRLWVEDQLIPIAAGDGSGRSATFAEDVAHVVGLSPTVLDESWRAGTPAHRVAMEVGSGDSSGVLVLSLNPRCPFDDAHRSFVELVGRTVSAALDNAYRRSVELGEQRLISDTLQAAMLAPASDLPTVAARYVPASGQLSVGGDWYDVIELPDGRRALVVGDCVGHGLAAATAMGQLRSASRALLLEGRPPAEVVQAMDHFAASVPGGDCATMACAVIDLGGRAMTYACAGHPPPVLVRAGTSSWLDGGRGGPLGVHTGDRSQARTAIEDGDLVVLYSDGLIERSGENIDDGLARLRRSAEAHAAEPVQSVADALLADLVDARPRDDVVVVVKRVR